MNEAGEVVGIEEAIDEDQPIYQISLEIDEINIIFLKSQYEALFKVFEQMNNF